MHNLSAIACDPETLCQRQKLNRCFPALDWRTPKAYLDFEAFFITNPKG
jgi:hypothetical protein